jgi:hypothetical protein
LENEVMRPIRLIRNALLVLAAVMASTAAWATDAYDLGIGSSANYPTAPVILSCVDDTTSPNFVAKPCGNSANPILSATGPSASSTVGIAPVVSASAEASHVLKASAGNLYGLSVTVTTVSGYVMIFDATSAPANGAVTPKFCFPITSNGTNGGAAFSWGSMPMYFATGITVEFSTTGCFTATSSTTAFFNGAVK